ncbi:MAG: sigma-54 dependent transcriptional regulator [Nitrospinota bacterium]|nr:sigma-54 dependent transcriptional regulator [Nitrospinota bacterium]
MPPQETITETSLPANETIHLLLVDDDHDILSTQAEYFRMHGINVSTASTAVEALKSNEKGSYDVIITDMVMPGMDGLELLKKLNATNAKAEVIIFTGFGTVESAIEAIREGAYSYLLKPLKVDRLLLEVQKAARTSKLRSENFILKHSDVYKDPTFYEFKSSRMGVALEQLKIAASSESAILLLGESGVGKEVAANFIHKASKRSANTFIKVHCASLSPGVLESELFGHEKGSFTGAVAERKGRFELANGGTIFLDEISTISMEIQIKLLRVLQEKQVERVGGSKTINVDFRLITASNQNLQMLVKEGKFRDDLYYRIGVIPVDVPPLREMKDDIPSLAAFFMRKFCNVTGKMPLDISAQALNDLANYSWPGNIRELQNVIERAVVLDRDGIIEHNDLPLEITRLGGNGNAVLNGDHKLKDVMGNFEKEYIAQVLSSNGYNVTKTAKLLDISRRNLQQKISRYNLKMK